MKTELESAIEFAGNREPRCLCVLLVDGSQSMDGEPINALNAGLQRLKDDLRSDPLARARVEIAVIRFGGNVSIEVEATSAAEFEPPQLVAHGGTPMGEAIIAGLDCLEGRVAEYRAGGIATYRPWFFLISDGQPTDDPSEARQRLLQAEEAKKLSVFTVAVPGADLATLSSLSARRKPAKLVGLQFAELFLWLSVSLRSVSMSQVDEEVKLKSVNDWGTV